MKFIWKYRYVPEGQLEPDKHGRWAIDCYVYVHIDKALPEYEWCKELFDRKHMPIRIATMHQKDTSPGVVPSMVHRFCVNCPSFDDAGNRGLTMSFFYSNDIDDLKRKVEAQFEKVQRVFRYCRK